MTLSTPIFSWCQSTKFSGMSRRVAKKWHALGVDSDWREPILWSFLAATLTGDSLTNKPPIYRIWTTRRAPKTFVPSWRLFCPFDAFSAPFVAFLPFSAVSGSWCKGPSYFVIQWPNAFTFTAAVRLQVRRMGRFAVFTKFYTIVTQ